MSGTISFTEVDTGSYVPGVRTEVRARYTNTGIAAYPAKALIFAQMLAGSPGMPNMPFQVTRLDQVTARAGAGSQAEDMARHFLAANPFTELWMVLLADPAAGTKAAGSITFGGAPTAAGSMGVYVAGKRVALTIAATDTAASIAGKLRTALAGRADLAVVGSGTTATVTVTAKHAGVIGNSLKLEVNRAPEEATPAGLTCTITAMTGGAGDADLTGALSAIASTWFTDLVLPVNDSTNLGLVTAELDRRFSAAGRLDAKAYAALAGTLSAATAWAQARNSRFLAVMPFAASSPTPFWCWAASIAGRAAFALAEDPARQLRGLTLPGVIAPAMVDRFIESEQNTLLTYGGSTFDVAADGTVSIQRLVTTYRTNPQGVADTAWFDIMTPAVLSRIRYDWSRYAQLTWPRHKLAPDGSPAAEHADNVVTPRQVHAAWATRCQSYERLGWIVEAGRTAGLSAFQLPPDGSRNRLQARLVVRVIDNLFNLDEALEFEA